MYVRKLILLMFMEWEINNQKKKEINNLNMQ